MQRLGHSYLFYLVDQHLFANGRQKLYKRARMQNHILYPTYGEGYMTTHQTLKQRTCSNDI